MLLGEPDPDALIAERLSGAIAVHEHRLVSGVERVAREHGARIIEGRRATGGARACELGPGAPAASEKAPEPSRCGRTAGRAEPARTGVARPGATKPPAHPERDPFKVSAHTIDMESILGELESPPAVAHASTESVEVDLSIVLNDITRPQPRLEAPEAPAQAAAISTESLRISVRTHPGAWTKRSNRYKQALALREAGDIDGCVVALQAASQAPKLRFATASILARICRDRGMKSSGSRVVRAGRTGTALTAEEGHDLLYDLADALEKDRRDCAGACDSARASGRRW